MTNYYQLLVGCHSDLRRNYVAGDVVKSSADLVKVFGSDKFRRLSDKEIAAMQTKEPSRKRTKVKRRSA
jgi:hypothetical protein